MVRFLNRIKEQKDPNTPHAGLTQCCEGEGCRNRCESILIVSSQWSIISLSMGTVLGATIGRSEEVNRKYLSTTVHMCTCGHPCVPVCTCSAPLPTCDKSGFGPPPPFAPGHPTLFFFRESWPSLYAIKTS